MELHFRNLDWQIQLNRVVLNGLYCDLAKKGQVKLQSKAKILKSLFSHTRFSALSACLPV